MKVLMFPGQGSQFKGMGIELFDAYPEMTARADAVLGYSIRQLCLGDAERPLANTRYTQPAIFVVSALAFRRYLDEGGERTFACAGHSLGEYAALHAGGVLDFESGLSLVKRRGELMAAISGGAMCAVLGLERERVAAILEAAGVDVDIANHNSFTQIVLSGAEAVVGEAERALKAAAAGCRVLRLPVSGAFHSRMMQSAAAQFGEALRSVRFVEPMCDIVANCSVEPYRFETVITNLERQLVSPVRWLETMQYFIDRGATSFLELGPGEVLSRLGAEIRSRHVAQPIATARRAAEPAAAGLPATDGTRHGIEPHTPARTAPNPFFERWKCSNVCVAGCIGPRHATPELLAALARAGVLVFAPGSDLDVEAAGERIEAARRRAGSVDARALIGLNIQAGAGVEHEARFALAEDKAISAVELVGFMRPDAAMLRYRARGLAPGEARSGHRLMVKVRDLDSALAFARTPPEALVVSLLSDGSIDAGQAAALRTQPVADAICIDGSEWRAPAQGQPASVGTLLALLREHIDDTFGSDWPIVLGAAGAIGTPSDIVAARCHGAGFVVLGSALQISDEAGLPRDLRERIAAAAPAHYRKVLDGFGLQYGLQSCAIEECAATAAALRALQAALREFLAGRESASDARAHLAERAWPLALPPSADASAWHRWFLECASLLGQGADARVLASPAASSALRWWRRTRDGLPDAAALLHALHDDARGMLRADDSVFCL